METTAACLNAKRAAHLELRGRARSVWTEQDFIAVGATGRPVGRESLAIAMRSLCEEAEISPHVTPYELRHTAISHQGDTGHTSWEIADWAGTSEAMISYRHRVRPAD